MEYRCITNEWQNSLTRLKRSWNIERSLRSLRLMANPKIERSSCHLSVGHFATENNNFWIESCRSEYRSNKNFHFFVIELIIDIYIYILEGIRKLDGRTDISRLTRNRQAYKGSKHNRTQKHAPFSTLDSFLTEGNSRWGTFSKKSKRFPFSLSLSVSLLFLFYWKGKPSL